MEVLLEAPEGEEQDVAPVVEMLLDEFSEKLRRGEDPDPDPFVERCPADQQDELRSLMNTLLFADRGMGAFRGALVDDPS